MKQTIYISSCFIFLFLFCFQGKSQENNLLSYKLSKIGPKYDTSWRMNGYDTTANFIYLYKDIVLIYHLVEQIFYNNGVQVSSGFYKRYFIHHKDSLFGFLFDSSMMKINQRMHIDSGSHERSLFNDGIEKDFKTLKINTLQLSVAVDQHSFKDIYYIVDEVDSTKKSIWTLTYCSLMRSSPLSISTYMDSLRSSKLVEIRSDEPERYFEKEKYKMAPFYFIFRMEPYESDEKENVMRLIKLYAAEIGYEL